MIFGLNKKLKNSNKLYEKAKKYIASGTNTFSRAPGVFPDGGAPKVLQKQKGCHVWDVDGNKFVDMVMGCGPVTLGHCDRRIDKAIKSQLNKGICGRRCRYYLAIKAIPGQTINDKSESRSVTSGGRNAASTCSVHDRV